MLLAGIEAVWGRLLRFARNDGVAITVIVGFLSLVSMAVADDIPETTIEEGIDFSVDGARARSERRIIMVLVSQTECAYCVLIKEEIIHPMILGGDYKDEILIREIHIDLDAYTLDFQGKETTAAEFAYRYNASLTPTLLFLGPDGQELAEKMVGINTPEMYFYYVDESIKKALSKR